MSGNQPSGIKFHHLLTVLYFSIIVLIVYSSYLAITTIYSFFYPEQQVVRFQNVELIEQQLEDTLLTSRANIDGYLILKKIAKNKYNETDESLEFIRSKNYKLENKKKETTRQLCIYSVEVNFGYKNWTEIVNKAKRGENENGWPSIIGIYTKRRLTAPGDNDVTIACRDKFKGSMDEISQSSAVISKWLISDSIYRTHLEQGVDQVVDIALWESSVECGVDKLTQAQAQSCEKNKENIFAWRNFQLNKAPDIMALGRSSKNELGMPALTAAPVRGVYKETYSSLIFINAKGRLGFVPFTTDSEVAVQRDVMTATYGSSIYFRHAKRDFSGKTIIYASTPSVVMKSLMKNEYVVFSNEDMDELRKAVGMAVPDYLQRTSNEIIDKAIAVNERRAIETSKNILSQKISMLKPVSSAEKKETSAVIVKFTDISPDNVGFEDVTFTDFFLNKL